MCISHCATLEPLGARATQTARVPIAPRSAWTMSASSLANLIAAEAIPAALAAPAAARAMEARRATRFLVYACLKVAELVRAVVAAKQSAIRAMTALCAAMKATAFNRNACLATPAAAAWKANSAAKKASPALSLTVLVPSMPVLRTICASKIKRNVVWMNVVQAMLLFVANASTRNLFVAFPKALVV